METTEKVFKKLALDLIESGWAGPEELAACAESGGDQEEIEQFLRDDGIEPTPILVEGVHEALKEVAREVLEHRHGKQSG